MLLEKFYRKVKTNRVFGAVFDRIACPTVVLAGVRRLFLLVILLCCTSLLAMAQGHKNRLMIEMMPGALCSSPQVYAKGKTKVKIVKKKRFEEVCTIESSSHAEVVELKKALSLQKNIRSIEFDAPVYPQVLPNDANFSTAWGLNNTGQSGGTVGVDIGMKAVWDVIVGTPEIVIAVIDTGIDYTHSDLAPNMWNNPGEIAGNGIDDDGNGYIDDVVGYDFADGDNDPSDLVSGGSVGHGTNVAGIIAAKGNNSIGVSGVTWSAKLMALKFIENGSGLGYKSVIVEAINYAVDNGADVINASYSSSAFSPIELAAIQAARDAGILFIAAAGNDGANIDTVASYPAAYDVSNVISVAASDHNDAIASFSNTGIDRVDIAAPGVGISSTHPIDSYKFDASGTSFAAPYVTGAVALIKSHFNAYLSQDIKRLILSSAKPVPGFEALMLTGRRLDVANAILCTPTALSILRNSPLTSLSANVGDLMRFSVDIHSCGKTQPGVTAYLEFDNGDPNVALLDDGVSPDVTANDGVYSGEWSSYTSGVLNVTAVATHAALSGVSSVFPANFAFTPTYTLETAAYDWIDTSMGLNVASGDKINLGFQFNFYGQVVDAVKVYENGIMHLVKNGAVGSTDPLLNFLIPTPAVIPSVIPSNNFVAPFWEDLSTIDAYSLTVDLLGVAPKRKAVVEWRNVTHTGDVYLNTYQVVLEEETGNIVFNYNAVGSQSAALKFGAGALIGIENSMGEKGTMLSSNAPVLANQSTYVFASSLKPVATLNIASEANIAEVVSMSATVVSNDAGLQYAWDFGDGNVSTLVSPNHVYQNAGVYTVSLVVSNDSLTSEAVSKQIMVGFNAAPVAVLLENYAVVVGESILFDASDSYDADGDNITYLWDFGGGNSSSLVNPRILFTNEGAFRISLTVSDEFLDSAVAYSTVVVSQGMVGQVDMQPPATKVSDVAGIYANEFRVTLTCEDAQVGCGNIYYSLDGSVPDENSLIYSAPVLVSEDVVLTVRSVDLADNWEVAQVFSYVIRIAPDEAVSTVGYDGEGVSRTKAAGVSWLLLSLLLVSLFVGRFVSGFFSVPSMKVCIK